MWLESPLFFLCIPYHKHLASTTYNFILRAFGLMGVPNRRFLSNECVILDELRNQLKDSEASYLYTDPDELVKVDEAIAQGVALKVSSLYMIYKLNYGIQG